MLRTAQHSRLTRCCCPVRKPFVAWLEKIETRADLLDSTTVQWDFGQPENNVLVGS